MDRSRHNEFVCPTLEFPFLMISVLVDEVRSNCPVRVGFYLLCVVTLLVLPCSAAVEAGYL